MVLRRRHRSCSRRARSTRSRCGRPIEREHVNILTVVGDAVAKPLLDAWDAEPGPVGRVVAVLASPTAARRCRPACKARILATFPNVLVNDGFGSSEAGIQGSSRVTAADAPRRAAPSASTGGAKPILVLDDDDRPVEPGSGVVGRIVTGGRLPLGYHNDPEKTAATFVEVDGERWLVTGDLATVADDGTVDLLGRGLDVDQHRRREGPPRGGRGRPPRPPRGGRRARGRRARRALGERGHRGRAAGRRRAARRSTSSPPTAGSTARRLQGPQAPRASWTASCARPPARPTTAGPSTSRSPSVDRVPAPARSAGPDHRPATAGRSAAGTRQPPARASQASVSDGRRLVGLEHEPALGVVGDDVPLLGHRARPARRGCGPPAGRRRAGGRSRPGSRWRGGSTARCCRTSRASGGARRGLVAVHARLEVGEHGVSSRCSTSGGDVAVGQLEEDVGHHPTVPRGLYPATVSAARLRRRARRAAERPGGRRRRRCIAVSVWGTSSVLIKQVHEPQRRGHLDLPPLDRRAC